MTVGAPICGNSSVSLERDLAKVEAESANLSYRTILRVRSVTAAPLAFNESGAGATPAEPTTLCVISQVERPKLANLLCAGAIPA